MLLLTKHAHTCCISFKPLKSLMRLTEKFPASFHLQGSGAQSDLLRVSQPVLLWFASGPWWDDVQNSVALGIHAGLDVQRRSVETQGPAEIAPLAFPHGELRVHPGWSISKERQFKMQPAVQMLGTVEHSSFQVSTLSNLVSVLGGVKWLRL